MSRLREVVALCALVACTRGEGTRASAEASAEAGAEAKADAGAGADAGAEAEAGAGADAGADAGTEAGADADAPADYLSPSPLRGKSLGHTSVVFKLQLSNGKRAVFKPSFRKGSLRYKGEIAAYRLARALGMDGVPPAYFRVMPEGALAAALDPTARALMARDVLSQRGEVRGAIIPWIDDLDFIALEAEPLWTKWRAWLRRGQAVGDPALARQISDLCVFDWLTGNWDRWSGGNVGLDKATGRLLVIDNDGAFFEVPPKQHMDRQWRLLEEIDRFSRSLARRVRGMDRAALASALGEEIPGVPLVSDAAMAGIVARQASLVALWDRKTSDAGAPEPLYFP